MANFQLSNGKAITSVTMHVGHSKHLRLWGGGPDNKPLTLRVSDPKIADISSQKLAGHDNTWAFILHARKPGAVKIEGLVQTGSRAGVSGATPLSVTIKPPLELPTVSSQEGALARLLLSENRTPYLAGYNGANSLTSMQWMRRVLENRLQHNPAQFGASGATILVDIIRAPGQFAGFEHYPTLSADVSRRMKDILAITNDDDHPKQEQFIEFVTNALSVAGSKTATIDPSPKGLFGWRTTGSGSPGPRFVLFKSMGGNDFYTLTNP